MTTVNRFINELPYPIALVYRDLSNVSASPQMQREAVYLSGYQLMRTIALTFVDQYLSRDPRADAPYSSRRKLNNAIAGVRSAHYNDWVSFLDSLNNQGGRLGIDFFPEFAEAMARLNAEKVDISAEYGWMFNTPPAGLRPLDAQCILRNSVAHSGTGRDDFCRTAVTADHALGTARE